MSKARVKDRISGLPDPVLCHILSFLPTKYAVRTSILSTRWQTIWSSVPSLHFECNGSRDSAGFMTFVDRVFYFRGSSDIQKFRLHCSSVSDFCRIDGWIRTAIKRNAVEIDLCLSYIGKKFELPKSLFMCKTLVVLKVNLNCITYNPPTSGCFPSLKLLHVTAKHPDSDSMEKLFTCCPVLEELGIDVKHGRTRDKDHNFKVSAPELKKLRMTFHRLSDLSCYDDEYTIIINAPKLENLELKQDFLCNYFWENVESLVKASVDLYFHHAYNYNDFSNRATALLAGISKVKSLSLSAHILQGDLLPAFDNLSELKLVLHDCYCWPLLTELLQRAPNLEYLLIDHKKDEDCLEPGWSAPYTKDTIYKEHHWKAPMSVPACLISHIKRITMRRFMGYPHEKKAATFLLENGKVLDKMTIYTEFLTVQRGSKTCQLEIN